MLEGAYLGCIRHEVGAQAEFAQSKQEWLQAVISRAKDTVRNQKNNISGIRIKKGASLLPGSN
jgi:hypothetical protein